MTAREEVDVFLDELKSQTEHPNVVLAVVAHSLADRVDKLEAAVSRLLVDTATIGPRIGG
jgi:hypothetical protein